jgi:hypothetical protein
MSKVTDENLRPHLTALVDGELEPLEAIALQQRLRQSPALAEEYRELERLKVAVHLAGTRDKAPAALEGQLERMCQQHFAREARVRAQLRWVSWGAPLGLAASLLIGVVLVSDGPHGTPSNGAGETAAKMVRDVDPTDRVLARLVEFHRDHASPMRLRDLSDSGALLAVERVPDSFIVPEGQKPRLVQASYMGCHEREGGSTLAVLDARQVDLPQRIVNALETTGVFVDSIGGVSVRLSVSGDKVFVLLSSEESTSGPSPI